MCPSSAVGTASALLLLLVPCTVPEATHAFGFAVNHRSTVVTTGIQHLVHGSSPGRSVAQRHRCPHFVSAAMTPPWRWTLHCPSCLSSRVMMGDTSPRRYTLGVRSALNQEGCIADTINTTVAKMENAAVFNQDDVVDGQRYAGDSQVVVSNAVGGGGGEAMGGKSVGDGIGWLHEFGNGKTDLMGLVLSTVLLMTAVAPIGSAADFPAAERSLDRTVSLDQNVRLPETGAAALTPSTGLVQPVGLPVGLGNNGGRVHGMQWADSLHNSGPSAGVEAGRVGSLLESSHAEGVSSQVGGTLAKITDDTVSVVRGAAGRTESVTSRVRMKASSLGTSRTTTTAKTSLPGEENRGITNSEPGLPSSDTTTSPEVVMAATGANEYDVSGGDSERRQNTASEAQQQLLEKLETEHAVLFQESLPVPTFPESFTRALRASLPALMPPLMTVFVLVSMPVVTLLLKGIGTTLVAIVNGYGREDDYSVSSEEGNGPGNSLEVGFGGSDGGKRRIGRNQETAGSAFGMLLGGSRGQSGGEGESSEGTGDKVTVGATKASSGLDWSVSDNTPPVHVQTERKGFFDKIRPDSTEKGGGHGVTDDAMAAMAMAAMTQELDQMKRSLQNEVEILKQELEQASDDSKRLTDKLCRLERDNRQLGVVVSRLGGHDASRLKAQLFRLLSASSTGELGDSSQPQLGLA